MISLFCSSSLWRSPHCICEIHRSVLVGFDLDLNTVHWLSSKENYLEKKILAEPGFAPGAAGWEARMLPLCYTAPPPPIISLNFGFYLDLPRDFFLKLHLSKFSFVFQLVDWKGPDFPSTTFYKLQVPCCSFKQFTSWLHVNRVVPIQWILVA